jgi:hypothetical protein
VLDSGCTKHMTKNRRMFTSIDNEGLDCDKITFGDNSKGKVKGLGKIVISNDLSISNVLLVESLSYNLLSVAQNYVILVLYVNSLLRILSLLALKVMSLSLKDFVMSIYILLISLLMMQV